MASQSEPRSRFVQFLDAFLQEENIKWLLGLGVCILLGSSLRLVTSHWNECTPVWKYLILLGYSGAVFGLGRFSYHRLGLRKTGTVLMALTVLLIPISFFALHWVRPTGDAAEFDWWRNTGLTALLAVNFAWSAYAARQIFQHFLRRTQPTFLVAYLLLCVAGAVVPGLPAAWAPVLALALWAVFAAGTVKVNRHVFWLTEEYQLPRIFGFFPIALLGAQFAAVCGFALVEQLTIPWMGLLCTLIALPILLTADAVARVFEQRTGGLVRPIPFSIIGPIALGTVLCAAGVVLALTTWPANPTVVPTAVLAAVAMGVVAQRTQKTGFVWGMVFCILIAYQTAPAFFKELVLYVRDQAAAAVREEKLPYAFYGLTYAPLILAFSFAATILKRRQLELFSGPLRIVANTLPWVLMAAAFLHVKAVLPVSLVLCPLFLLQAHLFRQPLSVLPGALAFLSIAFGLPGFCRQVLGIEVTTEMALMLWTAAAALLFFPGRFVDRWSRTQLRGDFQTTGFAFTDKFCELVSLIAGCVGAQAWIYQFSLVTGPFGFTVAAFIIALMATHALQSVRPGLSEATVAFAVFVAQRFLVPFNSPLAMHIDALSFLLLGLWGLSYVLERLPRVRFAMTFGEPAKDVSVFGLAPLFAWAAWSWLMSHAGMGYCGWMTGGLLMVWALDATRRLGNPLCAGCAWSALFLCGSAAVSELYGVQAASSWWLMIWTVIGLALFALQRGFISRFPNWLSPLVEIVPVVWLAIAVVSLPILDEPQQFAGLLALAGLAVASQVERKNRHFDLLWPLANWHLIAGYVTWMLGAPRFVLQITPTELATFGLPLAALAGLSALLFEAPALRRRFQHDEVATCHQFLLFVLAGLMLAGAVSWHAARGWTGFELGCVLGVWIAAATTLWTNAARRQQRDLVWFGLMAVFATWIYFVVIGVCTIHTPALAYWAFGIAVTCWCAGRAAAKSERYAIFSEPFQQTGFWLPLAVVPIALLRHLHAEVVWAGANSLPLLLTAAFYFWRGLKDRSLGVTVLSACILNLAFVLLWTNLHWTDPQLFLMPIGISILVITELLEREIPAAHHNELRFVGALTILVSPTFHIVTGSWLHMLTLMIAAVAVALVSIGLRIRVLLYTSTAFLLADLVAVVARGSVDHPNLLWIVGVILGSLVITLGAICENHRETLLARIRVLAAAMEQWR